MFVCVHCESFQGSLSDFAYTFSPLVEETAPGTVVLNADGCELLFGSAYGLATEITRQAARPETAGGLNCKVSVALAGNPDAAIHAARFFKGVTFINPGDELTGLGDLPVSSLCFQLAGVKEKKDCEEILGTLKLWGIRTFRDFATLPTAGVSERLGQTGVRLQKLASGKTDRHLKLIQPAPVFENSIDLDYPLAALEPLSFILARLLNQLCAKLNAYALATNELRVRLKLENGTFHDRELNLPYAMRDHKVFLKLLLLDAEMNPPPLAIVAVALSCTPVKPRVAQNGLFIPLAPEPEKLELTLARLAKLIGPGNLGSPEVLDTHRPDAFRIKRFALKRKERRRGAGNSRISQSSPHPFPIMGFRVFRPPLRAVVEDVKGFPKQISAWSAERSVHGKIVQTAGPWRATGDWWRADAWARDEWDVAIESRATRDGSQELYRIYRELRQGSWFVAGVYD